MTKKRLIFIIIGLIIVAAGAIFLIRFLTRPEQPLVSGPPQNQAVVPPITDKVPVSTNKEIETLTGILDLENVAILKVGEKNYSLRISNTDAAPILKAQGYKSGDRVNVMGKLDKNVIIVSGLNKFIQ